MASSNGRWIRRILHGGKRLPSEAELELAHERMVQRQLCRRGITAQRVLEAFKAVPRHLFLKREQWDIAYQDSPLPIGNGQTISQPYIVALMSQQLANLPQDAKVLEIGAGCGFQTAILVQMGFEVHAIELVDTLTQIAAANLQRIGLQPASLVTGNGRLGLPDEAPFDAILCAAASNNIPEAWYEQLRDAGQLIAPLGEQGEQTLIRCEKDIGDWKRESLGAVAFVPLVEASIE